MEDELKERQQSVQKEERSQGRHEADAWYQSVDHTLLAGDR